MNISYLRSILDYNPETGIFLWALPRRKAKVGNEAGYIKKNKGYRYIEIDGKTYAAHRLAWVFVNGKEPKNFIDHINGIKSDNRIKNLREATNGQNRANSLTNNKYGLKGVSYKKWIKKNPWMAQITFNKKVIYIGCFPTKEEAHKAYCEKAKNLHGDFFKS
jgi:hypothetical protein